MRCSRDGRFMRRLTPTSHYYICSLGCKEIRDDRPELNFAMMLLGFTRKAARP